MEQSRKLLVAILVSTVITNIILLSVTGASLMLVYKLNKEVEQLQQRVDEVRQVVDKLKAVRDTVKDRIQDRRAQDSGEGQDTRNNEGEKSTEEGQPPPRRPLQRLRESR